MVPNRPDRCNYLFCLLQGDGHTLSPVLGDFFDRDIVWQSQGQLQFE
jgi:hypothetical protein